MDFQKSKSLVEYKIPSHYVFREKKQKIPFIKQNIHESIYDIVNNMERIQPPVNLKNEENSSSVEFILSLGLSVPEEFTEVIDYVVLGG